MVCGARRNLILRDATSNSLSQNLMKFGLVFRFLERTKINVFFLLQCRLSLHHIVMQTTGLDTTVNIALSRSTTARFFGARVYECVFELMENTQELHSIACAMVPPNPQTPAICFNDLIFTKFAYLCLLFCRAQTHYRTQAYQT
jgi:hypothetical protein